jgi:hypothetical protein
VTVIVGGDTGRTLCTCAEGCVEDSELASYSEVSMRTPLSQMSSSHEVSRKTLKIAMACATCCFNCRGFLAAGGTAAVQVVSLWTTHHAVSEGGGSGGVCNFEPRSNARTGCLAIEFARGLSGAARATCAEANHTHIHTHAHARALTSSEIRSY